MTVVPRFVLVASALAVSPVASARSPDPLPRRNQARIAEIAAMLPERPSAPGARASDRTFWNRLAADPSARIFLASVEKMSAIPEQPLGDYLEYFNNGDRTRFENPYFQRRGRLDAFILAECLEHRGRYLPSVKKVLGEILDERCWCVPAHDRTVDGKVGGHACWDGKVQIVDLFASARAWTVAYAVDWLGDELGPELVARAKGEIRRRVIGPYLADARAERPWHAWWFFEDFNWNAVCHAGCVGTALAVVESREERAECIEAAERARPSYLSGFGPDCYCQEGLGYWSFGFGHEIQMGLDVREATGGRIDFLAGERVRRIASYARDFILEPGLCPNFADGGGVSSAGPEVLSQAALVWPDLFSGSLATPLFAEVHRQPADRHATMCRIVAHLARRPSAAPAAGREDAPLPLRAYWKTPQVLISRTADRLHGHPFAVAMKGGSNGEIHNHNDVGSYVIDCAGERKIGDPGGELYTARTFSARRYESKVLSSYGHPVPLVAGRQQSLGGQAAAKVLKSEFTDARDTLILDLTAAYDVPELRRLVRRFVFDRTKRTFAVTDRVSFSRPCAFESPVVAYGTVTFDYEKGRFSITTRPDRAMDVSVTATGGEWSIRSELIENPKLASPIRLAVAYDQPVDAAEITVTFGERRGK